MPSLGASFNKLQFEKRELHNALREVLTILEKLAVAGVVRREHLTPLEQHAITMATHVHEDITV